MRRGLNTDARLGDVIEALEREITDRQRALLTLKAICSDLFKGNRGAPRKQSLRLTLLQWRSACEANARCLDVYGLHPPARFARRCASAWASQRETETSGGRAR